MEQLSKDLMSRVLAEMYSTPFLGARRDYPTRADYERVMNANPACRLHADIRWKESRTMPYPTSGETNLKNGEVVNEWEDPDASSDAGDGVRE